MDGLSLNITAELLAQLRQLMPDAFTEGKVDFDRLKAALGDADALAGPTHYELSWAGKADARREVQRQTAATLVPDRARSVDFDTTQNVFIEGENLEVLRVLQHAYHGQVKMIYIDPPYNTGNDSFVYPDDYSERKEDYLKRAGHTNDAGFLNKQDLWQKNSKESGQYHSAWLSMMWPRLYLSRNLLREDGVIFVSIDDNEVHNLRMLLNEVFGEENFVGEIIWQRSKKGDAKLIADVHEYILCFAKNKATTIAKGVWRKVKPGADAVLTKYAELKKALKNNHEQIREGMQTWYRGLAETDPRKAHKHYNWSDDRGLYFAADFAGPDDGRTSRPRHDILHPITKVPTKKPATGWRWDAEKTKWALAQTPPRIHFGPDENTIPNRKSYLEEISSEPFASVFYRDGRSATMEVAGLLGKGVFPFPKNVEVITDLLEIAAGPNDLILDFFAGSGTTAQAVMELNQQDGGNRKFVIVQMPEVVEENTEAHKAGYRTIADITQARIKKAGEKIKAAGAGKLPLDGGTDALDLGFRTYRLEYSNFKPWRADVPDAATVLGQLELFQEPLKDYSDAASAAMLTELLLKAGQPLDTPVAVRIIDDVPVHVVGTEGKLWLALTGISDAVVAACAAARPARLVVPGRLFDAARPDETINNARLTLEDAGVELQLI